jgi:hypothetical protein
MEGRQIRFHRALEYPRMYGEFDEEEDFSSEDSGEKDQEIWDQMMEHEAAELNLRKLRKGVIKRTKKIIPGALAILGLTAPELASLLYVYGKRLTHKFMEIVKEYVRGVEEKEERRDRSDRELHARLRQLEEDLVSARGTIGILMGVAARCLEREGEPVSVEIENDLQTLRESGEILGNEFSNILRQTDTAVKTLPRVAQADDELDSEILQNVAQVAQAEAIKDEQGIARGGGIEIPVDPGIAPPLPPRDPASPRDPAPPLPDRPSPEPQEESSLVLDENQSQVVRKVAADVAEEASNELIDVLKSSMERMRIFTETEIPEIPLDDEDQGWEDEDLPKTPRYSPPPLPRDSPSPRRTYGERRARARTHNSLDRMMNRREASRIRKQLGKTNDFPGRRRESPQAKSASREARGIAKKVPEKTLTRTKEKKHEAIPEGDEEFPEEEKVSGKEEEEWLFW